MSGSAGSTQQVITFEQIPAAPNWQVPGSWLEALPNQANIGILPLPARNLIIAQMTASGTAVAGTIIPNITQPLQARALGGPGSQIDLMCSCALPSNNTIPLDIICLADAAGSAAAAWTLTFTGPATANGTTAYNVAGQRVTVGTLNGDTATIAATEFAAAINAIQTLPVTATSAAGVVTITAKNKGLHGNDISFVQSPATGDVLPAGLTATVAQTVQGATNPSIAAAIMAIVAVWYTDIAIPYQDTANVAALSAELERRGNAMVHQDGRGHVFFTGTLSQQLASAAAANARFVYGVGMTVPGSTPGEYAASAMGAASQSLLADPSLQLDQVALPGVVGNQPANQPNDAEKNLLLLGGVSVVHVAQNGNVSLQRYVSTYTETPQGYLDLSQHDIMTQAVWSRIRYDWKAYFRSLYPTSKLAPDGSLAANANPRACTPKRAKASWAARYLTYATNGWLIDETTQPNNAVFIIDPNDKNRLDYTIPYTAIGNLMIDAGQLLFS